MAKLIRCPNCGAPFDKRLENDALCPYCGSRVLFDERIAPPAAPGAGAGRLPLVVLAIGSLVVTFHVVSRRQARSAHEEQPAVPLRVGGP